VPDIGSPSGIAKVGLRTRATVDPGDLWLKIPHILIRWAGHDLGRGCAERWSTTSQQSSMCFTRGSASRWAVETDR
jgi:hypothetical protein